MIAELLIVTGIGFLLGGASGVACAWIIYGIVAVWLFW